MQILSTKLSIPPVRSRLIVRPRLIQKLNQGLECGFILVSAPAGYGKSTLLSSWLNRLDCSSAWLSLDDDDNDPTRFLGYLVAALCIIDPSLASLTETLAGLSAVQPPDAPLTQLINHIAGRKHPACLVLDDYHVIQNQSIHQAVSFLVDHQPDTLKLVIATRADPPLPLARLRARSRLTELRMADLRFTAQEAADFLNHTMSLTVSEEDVARLTRRTEGWIAGLQIAALSMQSSEDISGFINNLTGSHHYVFDYLLEEILGRQTPSVQRFLLYTSILDQLTGSLCNALLEGEKISQPSVPSSQMLEELEHANLFIIPLDQEHRWYRYHPLFAELLRSYLTKTDPSRVNVLHARASTWFEAQGLIADAIRHSLAARDWEGVIRLISTNIFALLEQNELNNLARQIANLTSEPSPALPWLLVGRAWLAAYTGQLSSVESLLKIVESEIDNLKSELELQTLGGHLAAIRAYTNWIEDRWDLAASAARVALEWLPETEYLLRCQSASLLGLTLYDLDAGSQAFEQAIAYGKKTGISHVTIFAYGSWAWLLAMQGKLHQAHATCCDAIQLAKSSPSQQLLPTLSHVYTTLGFILFEWDDIEGALRYLNEAVNLARRWEQVDALHFALTYLGYALFASGEVAQAFNILHEAWLVATRTSQWFKEITISEEIDLELASGDLEAALRSVNQAHIDLADPSKIKLNPNRSGYLAMMYVRIYLEQKQYANALILLARLLQSQEDRKLGYFLVRLLIWKAMAHQGLRQDDLALAALKRALNMAASEGYIRTFIQAGPGLIPLLHQARQAGITPQYVDKLLKAVERVGKRPLVQPAPSARLIEPLTEREVEVLRLLAQGCTDKSIAESLVIARETVHKHLKNIYGKLDVHNRTEATVRARQLDLL